jgi:two-component system, NarL family, nitrate/nitrite response regulator NarL
MVRNTIVRRAAGLVSVWTWSADRPATVVEEGDMIRVAVIDDHPVARYGLKSIFAFVPDIEVVTSVPEPAFLPSDMRDRIDIVICDPYPFGEDGSLDVVRGLSAWAPVLVVSASREPASVLGALQAGARGYLTKQASDDQYEIAVRTVVGGRLYLAPPLADVLRAAGGRSPAAAARAALSDREQQALAYIARGFTHQQTARRMGVSKATVDTYVGRIRTKLRLGNKAELALAALRYVEPRYRQTAALSR